MIYARVQNTLCVTLDYMKPLTERDPMLVNDGTVCDEQKVSDPLTCSRPLGRRRTWRKHRCSSSIGALSGFSVGSTLKEPGWMDGGGVTPSRRGPAQSLMLPCEFPKDLQLSRAGAGCVTARLAAQRRLCACAADLPEPALRACRRPELQM